jgi:anthranilate synthase component 1
MKIKVQATRISRLADLQTPVGIYLKVRDLYPQSALLESSDYHSAENSFSYIGVEPIASFSVRGGKATLQFPDGTIDVRSISEEHTISDLLNDFIGRFEVGGESNGENGFFGYTAYDAVRYFDRIPIGGKTDEADSVPQMKYLLYRFVIAVNHLRDEMTITENRVGGGASKIDDLLSIIESRNFPAYDFRTRGETSSEVTDEEFRETVRRGIEYCRQGEVSQIVLSRCFEQSFLGDDFKVYRALRSVNPSPYLFYFDFGSFRIFGSSPETHLKIEGNTATIDPIAGTFRRTGNDEQDRRLAEALLEDPKENAEHAMLVDLAREDLAKNADRIEVKFNRQVQFYSHVIHLVSRVSGEIAPNANRIRVFADTFPAGTVSGAPKPRAMELIDDLEKHARGIYGGCIGHIGFDGNLNQAITIRTFVSRNNTLSFQAGAGIVAQSDPEKELQEVNNKLAALNRAIEIANGLNV